MFRVRVADAAIELVSPAIVKLTGIDVARCTQHPVLLTELVSAEERERVVFLYRRHRPRRAEIANAQVSVKRPDGANRAPASRHRPRRDTAGVVRHIDGVVTDAAREAEGALYGEPVAHDARAKLRSESGVHSTARSVTSGAPGPAPGNTGAADGHVARNPLARAAMELSHELLREGSQHLHTVGRELKGARAALKTHAACLPPGVADDLALRLEAAASASAGPRRSTAACGACSPAPPRWARPSPRCSRTCARRWPPSSA